MCLLLLALHASVQPYKRLRTNVAETVYLFILCILAVVQTLDNKDDRSTASAILLTVAAVHSGILCIYKFCRFCKKKCHCRCPTKLSVKFSGKYRSFDDNSEIVKPSVDPEVQAKQNLFDTVFASSTDSSDHYTSSRSYTHYNGTTDR